MLISALMVHLIPHLTGQLGYSLAFAGLVVALVTSMQLLGMVFGGVLGDRLSKRAIVVTAMIMHAGAALLLTVAVTPLLVVVFAVIHGVAWGARGPLQQAWRADLFGSTSFGAIMGFSSIVVMLGAAGGPLLAGILFDRLGDYTLTLRLLAVLAVWARCCSSSCAGRLSPRPPERHDSTAGAAARDRSDAARRASLSGLPETSAVGVLGEPLPIDRYHLSLEPVPVGPSLFGSCDGGSCTRMLVDLLQGASRREPQLAFSGLVEAQCFSRS
jgi:MFS family permease